MNSNWSYSLETAKLGYDLCDLDIWPWPFAWTSLLSLVINPENFMMIRWGNIVKNVWRTDRQTDGLNNSQSCLVEAIKICQFAFSIISRHWNDTGSDVFFDVKPNKLLYKQSSCRWFETHQAHMTSMWCCGHQDISILEILASCKTRTGTRSFRHIITIAAEVLATQGVKPFTATELT